MSAEPLVFLVTGATSGIGAALITEILARGDKAIASGRQVAQKLNHLLKDSSGRLGFLELDVASDRATIDAKMREAWAIFGRIDVVFNNAGMAETRAAEDADDALLTKLMTVNLIGPMRIAQAMLPLFRTKPQGGRESVLAFTSSGGAWGPLPFMSFYAASKAGISAWTEALAAELRGSGDAVRCVCFEPGGFMTQLGQPRIAGDDQGDNAGGDSAGPSAPYAPFFQESMGIIGGNYPKIMSGDLGKCAKRMVDVIKQEGMAAGKPPAVRVSLGSDGMEFARNKCEVKLKSLEAWRDVAESTDGEGTTRAEGYEILKQFLVL